MQLPSETLIQISIALASAELGAAMAIFAGVSHKQLCGLISFAAGSLFATTAVHIVPETMGTVSPAVCILALLAGSLFFFVVSRSLFHVCPACAASHFEEQTASSFQRIALMLAIALGIHNTMDGAAITMGHDHAAEIGPSIFYTVTIHKFPEGLALCALLLRSGYGKGKAFFVTLALEAMTFVGWLAGSYFLGQGFDQRWFDVALAAIGGGFVYLALHAVVNESKEHSPAYVLAFFLFGAVVISATKFLPG